MPFGAPGGDLQPQGMLQVLLDHVSIATAGVCAVAADRENGVLFGGADPRRAARAMGW
jgi:gamma-glutamyltranspeptidase